MRKKKKSFRTAAVLIACLFALIISPISAFGEEAAEVNSQSGMGGEKNSTNFKLYAKAAVLMDAQSGRILFGKNEDEVLPMASTTKIMTCILALECGNLEDYVAVSSKAASMPKVKLYMKEGEYYKLEDLLYSLMLESHNDTAVAVAEHIGGSVENFAAMMNQKARDIGCSDTFFVTPNGLDAAAEDGKKVHSTTAADLAKIMSYCIMISPEREKFLEITRTASRSFTNYKKLEEGYDRGGRTFSCSNHNAFLTMMEGALTGKTGFTNNAGYCYVGALRRDGKTLVVALLACGWPNHKTYKWADTLALMNYGLEHYHYRDVYREVEFKEMAVDEGIPSDGKPYGQAFVSVGIPGGDRHLELLLREDEKVERKVLLKRELSAPVRQGEAVGAVRYYLNGELLKEYPVTAKNSVERLSFLWIARYVAGIYLL